MEDYGLFAIDVKGKEVIIIDSPYSFSVPIDEFLREAKKIIKRVEGK